VEHVEKPGVLHRPVNGDGDKLTMDFGEEKVMKKLMQSEKTSPGWLAKYSEKNGPQALYKGKKLLEFQRPKKQ
jgi:hypothetical protein